MVVVVMSFLDLVLAGIPDWLVRLMRACRVIRLFGRFSELKKMVAAVSASVLAMMHSFFIFILVMSIYAILGVSLFKDVIPLEFGQFNRAFITMFRIASGDPWPASLPLILENGSVDPTNALFLCSFSLLVLWVVLQVSLAVLLDNFVAASARLEAKDIEKRIKEKKALRQFKNPLEPLVARLANSYIDKEDLSIRLETLFQALDVDGSGSLDAEEFCNSIKNLSFKPRLHMTKADFKILTENGILCNKSGHITPKSFEQLMCEQIRQYTIGILSMDARFMSPDEELFSRRGTLKMLLLEQENILLQHHRMQERLDSICFDSTAAASQVTPASGPSVAASVVHKSLSRKETFKDRHKRWRWASTRDEDDHHDYDKAETRAGSATVITSEIKSTVVLSSTPTVLEEVISNREGMDQSVLRTSSGFIISPTRSNSSSVAEKRAHSDCSYSKDRDFEGELKADAGDCSRNGSERKGKRKGRVQCQQGNQVALAQPQQSVAHSTSPSCDVPDLCKTLDAKSADAGFDGFCKRAEGNNKMKGAAFPEASVKDNAGMKSTFDSCSNPECNGPKNRQHGRRVKSSGGKTSSCDGVILKSRADMIKPVSSDLGLASGAIVQVSHEQCHSLSTDQHSTQEMSRAAEDCILFEEGFSPSLQQNLCEELIDSTSLQPLIADTLNNESLKKGDNLSLAADLLTFSTTIPAAASDGDLRYLEPQHNQKGLTLQDTHQHNGRLRSNHQRVASTVKTPDSRQSCTPSPPVPILPNTLIQEWPAAKSDTVNTGIESENLPSFEAGTERSAASSFTRRSPAASAQPVSHAPSAALSSDHYPSVPTACRKSLHTSGMRSRFNTNSPCTNESSAAGAAAAVTDPSASPECKQETNSCDLGRDLRQHQIPFRLPSPCSDSENLRSDLVWFHS